MHVEEVMSVPVHTCHAEDSLHDAGLRLWTHELEFLPVVTRDGRLASVLTDRDIALAACTERKTLRELRVGQLGAGRLLTARPDEELAQVAERMRTEQVTALPVVDAEGVLGGVVTLDDITQALAPGRRESPVARAVVVAGLVAAALGLGVVPAIARAHGSQAGASRQLFSAKLPNVPGKTLTVVSVEYAPGEASGSHRHPASGFVFAYVLSGSIRSQLEGEPAQVYRAGQSWTEPPDAHHVVSANASKTEPAKLLAVVIADDGVPTTVYDR